MKTKEIFIGKNIKRLRKKASLSRADLAEKLSYSAKSVEKWETGISLPPLYVVCALQSIFGVTFEELIYGKSDGIKYYLGIDGGATKTEFLLVGEQGEKISECMLESSNPADLGTEESKKVLKRGIESVCGDIPYSEISVFAGLSGVNTNECASIMRDYISTFGFGLSDVGNDIENVLELTLGGNDGVAVICGTGIAAFSQKNGIRKRVAGYGYLIDNGGSGYDIGRDAFEAAFKQTDGRGARTLITELLTEKLKKPLNDAIDDIYSGGKRFIASAAPIVFEAYGKGDKVSSDILERNMKSLALIINTAAKVSDKLPITAALCGGLCQREDIMKKFLLPHLSKHINPVFEKRRSVNGAVALARKAAENE